MRCFFVVGVVLVSMVVVCRGSMKEYVVVLWVLVVRMVCRLGVIILLFKVMLVCLLVMVFRMVCFSRVSSWLWVLVFVLIWVKLRVVEVSSRLLSRIVLDCV